MIRLFAALSLMTFSSAYADTMIQEMHCVQYLSNSTNVNPAIESVKIKLNKPVSVYTGYNLYGLKSDVEIEVTEAFALQQGLTQTTFTYKNINSKKELPGYSNEIQVRNSTLTISLLPVKSAGWQYEGVIDVRANDLNLWLTHFNGEAPLKCFAN